MGTPTGPGITGASTVYVLVLNNFDSTYIAGAYSSREKAETQILKDEGRKRLSKKLFTPNFGWEIIPLEIDGEAWKTTK